MKLLRQTVSRVSQAGRADQLTSVDPPLVLVHHSVHKGTAASDSDTQICHLLDTTAAIAEQLCSSHLTVTLGAAMSWLKLDFAVASKPGGIWYPRGSSSSECCEHRITCTPQLSGWQVQQLVHAHGHCSISPEVWGCSVKLADVDQLQRLSAACRHVTGGCS